MNEYDGKLKNIFQLNASDLKSSLLYPNTILNNIFEYNNFEFTMMRKMRLIFTYLIILLNNDALLSVMKEYLILLSKIIYSTNDINTNINKLAEIVVFLESTRKFNIRYLHISIHVGEFTKILGNLFKFTTEKFERTYKSYRKFNKNNNKIQESLLKARIRYEEVHTDTDNKLSYSNFTDDLYLSFFIDNKEFIGIGSRTDLFEANISCYKSCIDCNKYPHMFVKYDDQIAIIIGLTEDHKIKLQFYKTFQITPFIYKRITISNKIGFVNPSDILSPVNCCEYEGNMMFLVCNFD